MSWMVYIRQIHPSFLHFSTAGEGFALRDFSPKAADEAKAKVIKRQAPPEWTTTRIRQLASVTGNFLIEVPGAEEPVTNYRYWHEQTKKLNEQLAVRQDQSTSTDRTSVVVHTHPSGIGDHVAYIVATVVAAVLTAGILVWLKWR